MTRRDIAWRGLGVALLAVAGIGEAWSGGDAGQGMGVFGFALAVIGLVLVVQGRRVPAALRIERSQHRLLAQAIHARRRRR